MGIRFPVGVDVCHCSGGISLSCKRPFTPTIRLRGEDVHGVQRRRPLRSARNIGRYMEGDTGDVEHLVMRRDGRVVDEVAVVVATPAGGPRLHRPPLEAEARAWQRGQRRPLPRGRVDHLVLQDQDEAVAVVRHLSRDLRVARPVVEVVEPAGDVPRGGAPREELRGVDLVDVVDDGVEGEREQVRAQQAVVVDGGAPRPADAAGGGEGTRREVAEYVRQQIRVLHVHVHDL